jgi:hypothetical protein
VGDSLNREAVCDLFGAPFTSPPRSSTCMLVQDHLKVQQCVPLHMSDFIQLLLRSVFYCRVPDVDACHTVRESCSFWYL